MKISGALKKIIKKKLAGYIVNAETNPQNYAKAWHKIQQRQEKKK